MGKYNYMTQFKVKTT